MSALAFDTHRAVKALCEAGAAEPLAEAFVETIGDAVAGNVATKADIDRVETTLKAEIAEVKADVDRVETTLKAEIAESEARVQAKIADVQAETKADIAGVRTEVANVRAELRPTSVWSEPRSATWRGGCIGSCGSWRQASSGSPSRWSSCSADQGARSSTEE